jgi:hemin uptake protein HemP
MNATKSSNKFLLCPNCGKIGIENLVSNGNIAHCKTCNHPIIEMRYLSVQAQAMVTGDGKFTFDHDGQSYQFEIDHDGCIQFETGKLNVVYLLESRNMACAVIHAVHMLKADKLNREVIAQNTSIAFMPYQASEVTSTMDMASQASEVKRIPQPVQQQQAQHGGKSKTKAGRQLPLFQRPQPIQQDNHGKPKDVKKATIPFSQAVSIALRNVTSEMLERAKSESVKKFESRVKSFLGHEFNPSLGLVGSIQAYLNRLKLAGKSASYIRGMKSVLNSFMAYLPTCQIDFSGVTI